ncbi:SrfA family protein [Scandinavium sp. V105_16]|uniref:SrfA family protein n=1 Tax=Scandinavium lactucae TaxID=3095028 RepID=A0AAJ2SC52_9ENTR|nr:MULTISPECIES: SrfA family protein [unclassified Scandinavium]MDX6022334.1 SrfA family protein [Scandinavium sp. V105_16]MDX6033824.1 SrfA family protein [Scandinavium sp. V105_12]MDX6042327.1 SrfA family protein [Scandinavium sp. V105_6]MDX6052328.1 SrfA family protein [Scandinavium sp. V105_1]
MAKTLLRSGSLDDFQSLGGGGQAVFASALQIRETLRLRKQQLLVDCLAVPQVNDEGDRVDWYSPVEGDVLAWKAADDNLREHALRQLKTMADDALSLARKCQQSDKTAQQLFGALLEKALQFPGENHVFLVGGKPVLTFWGFVNLNESAREELLGCLHLAPVPEPQRELDDDIPEADSVKVTFSDADEPLLAAPVSLSIIQQPVAEPDLIPEPTAPAEIDIPSAPVAEKKARRIPLWSLPVAAVIVAAVAGPLLWPRQTTSAEPVVAHVEPEKLVPERSTPPLPALNPTLPLHQAIVTASAAPTIKEDAKPVVIAAIPKDALVMEADQMRAGTTRFLNGNWRVLVDVKDPVTGKAPSLRYQIQNNKGTVRLVHGDSVVCKSEIFSGLHQNGELMIKSRGNARCSDGSRYPMPEISCKAGTSDVAECTGRYDANTVVPITFRKVGA